MRAPPESRTMAVVPSWIEAHCVIPDGFKAGAPFRLYDDQLLYFGNFYLVRGDAVWIPEEPVLAPSFVYARAIVVAPQKWGKNPMGAAHICVEGEGPVVFAGWAGVDDGYVCADNGCGCGWEYAYELGEPMGMAWPTPLIQVTAYSEDQTDNTWTVLRPMIQKGPLADLIPAVGEKFIRLRGPGDEALIEVVTSSELSRLGARTTFVLQDQLESWWQSNGMDKVADAQYRNLGGIGGRASLLANAWDPTQQSVAQREFESGEPDVYRQATFAPTTHACGLPDEEHDHFADPLERRAIFEAVYPLDHRRGHGGHADLDSIDAEARKIHAYDSAQARRYYGNEIVEGAGKAFDITVWLARRVPEPKVVAKRALITIGFDGSRTQDHTSLIATEVATGYQWPLGIWRAEDHDGDIPSTVIDARVDWAFETFDVWRLYADPFFWRDTIKGWAGRYGNDRIIEWQTNRPKPMASALRSWGEAQRTGVQSHCAEADELCDLFTQHVGNAVRFDTGYKDEDNRALWIAVKERKNSPKKIDSVPAACLSWEARNDAIAAGALNVATSAYDGLSPAKIRQRMQV